MDKRDFHVAVKGLFFDERGRVLVLKEASGVWELPGGRLEHGEDIPSALKRECREEMGIDCEVLDAAPRLAWSAFDRDGFWKVVLCFRIRLPRLDFVPSEECIALDFFDKAGLEAIDLAPQMRPLRTFL